MAKWDLDLDKMHVIDVDESKGLHLRTCQESAFLGHENGTVTEIDIPSLTKRHANSRKVKKMSIHCMQVSEFNFFSC